MLFLRYWIEANASSSVSELNPSVSDSVRKVDKYSSNVGLADTTEELKANNTNTANFILSPYNDV